MISEAYRKEQEELHLNPQYGVASTFYAPLVDKVVTDTGLTDILDYGAGKQRLKDSMKECCEYHAYDPAIPSISSEPSPHDVVVCLDVLEHIEPDCLDSVLDHLQHLTLRFGLFTIHTGPAAKFLSDGRNAHLIQEPIEWWLHKMEHRFKIQAIHNIGNGFLLFVSKRDINLTASKA